MSAFVHLLRWSHCHSMPTITKPHSSSNQLRPACGLGKVQNVAEQHRRLLKAALACRPDRLAPAAELFTVATLGPNLAEVLKHSFTHIPESKGTRPHLLLQPSGRPLEPASGLWADKAHLQYLPAGRGQVCRLAQSHHLQMAALLGAALLLVAILVSAGIWQSGSNPASCKTYHGLLRQATWMQSRAATSRSGSCIQPCCDGRSPRSGQQLRWPTRMRATAW